MGWEGKASGSCQSGRSRPQQIPTDSGQILKLLFFFFFYMSERERESEDSQKEEEI